MSEKSDYIRVPTTMPADMIESLEKLSLKAKITGGKKLANTEIVRAFILYGLGSWIVIDGCRDEDDVIAALDRAVAKK